MKHVFYILPLLAACSADVFDASDANDAQPDAQTADAPVADAGLDSPGDLDGSGTDANETSTDGGLGESDAFDGMVTALSRRVFVTSATHTADFGGLSQGDAICQSAASGLGGTWKAWLSTSTVSVESRLEHATVPYKLLTGIEVAADWSGLSSGTLEHDINVDEHKNAVSVGTFVFTASSGNGSSLLYDCAGWTSKSSAVNQSGGEVSGTDYTWTQAYQTGCNLSEPLYCVEQP